MKKRIFSLFLVLSVMITVLSGCVGAAKVSDGKNGENPITPSVSPELPNSGIKTLEPDVSPTPTSTPPTPTQTPTPQPSEPIILFHGITLDEKDRDIRVEAPEDKDNLAMLESKYNIEYSLYKNGKFYKKQKARLR